MRTPDEVPGTEPDPSAGEGAPGAEEEPTFATPLLGTAWKILTVLSGLLVLFLGVGLALPGTWTATRERVVPVPPDSVFPWLDVLERWQRWTPWPEVEITRSGPPGGEGATMSWDDPFAGDGRFTIVTSEPPRRLTYRVEVEGGSMVTLGTFELQPVPEGTRVRWTEEGDFGWNPLMGWAALRMDRVQGAELERALRRLETVLTTGALPDDSGGAPARRLRPAA